MITVNLFTIVKSILKDATAFSSIILKAKTVRISFIDYIYSLIQFWSIEVVLSGIKREPGGEFERLGSQKVDFYELRKKFIYVPFSQFFIILRIGHNFLLIFG